MLYWGIFAFLIAAGLFVVSYTTWQIFKNTLYTGNKRERTRACPEESCDAQKEMFAIGTAWAARYKEITEPLHIVNDGLNLYGEYINFGHAQCAVIVQGRTESLLYSYYYADVYAENGYNILVIDTRAHGLSDGNCVTAGVLEHKDLILWIHLVKERYSVASFLIHGVCIGAAAGVYAYCAAKEENLIGALVLDGLYTSYYEIFRNHIIERKKPVWFFVHLTFFCAYLCTGANLIKETPYKRMGEIEIPALFIWGGKDIYCTKEKSNALFQACKSAYKEKKFFANGGHSFVRYYNLDTYDKTIHEFLNKER